MSYHLPSPGPYLCPRHISLPLNGAAGRGWWQQGSGSVPRGSILHLL